MKIGKKRRIPTKRRGDEKKKREEEKKKFIHVNSLSARVSDGKVYKAEKKTMSRNL
jgi:hypothetical protein